MAILWYYYGSDGSKQGPVNDAQLKTLVLQGVIVPDTDMETSNGHRGKAGQIRGLFPPMTTPESATTPETMVPETTPVPTPKPMDEVILEENDNNIPEPIIPENPIPKEDKKKKTKKPKKEKNPEIQRTYYCTNCGHTVNDKKEKVCLSCGAETTAQRKNCRYCGVSVKPEQVICLSCGATIERKSRITAILLAIFTGWMFGQKFYLGSKGWGVIALLILIVSGGTAAGVFLFWSFFDAIHFLAMTDGEFELNYPVETQTPFRW